MVLGPMSSNDSPSYTGSSVATGRTSHASQIDGEKPEEQGTFSPPRLLVVGCRTDNHNY